MTDQGALKSPPQADASHTAQNGEAPWPGVHDMPRWTTGELSPPPLFRWRNLPMLLGPGLVMGAAAVGGGEWLMGPVVTARFGGALLWLCTLSILGQVLYNIEISRYALYCGEPIFTGKFRTPPGPKFWPFIYLLLDFGSFLPYLMSSAAIPIYAMYYGELPDTKEQGTTLQILASVLFIGILLPLVVGGKVYRSLRYIMTFKLILVMGFLLFLAIGYSTLDTWLEIFSGFFKFGTLPVIDPGIPKEQSTAVSNFISDFFAGESFAAINFSVIGIVAAMAAISGNGGLTNTPISNFTRDQGWGMGKDVGAIPSIIGGHAIQLSHVGKVFEPNEKSIPRWKGWMAHVQRDQLLVWMPACFLGIALPSMLSVQFLERGSILKDNWLAAAMTADGVAEAVGPTLGPLFWQLTLFCGFLVLATAGIMTADGVLRRWVDVFWTASPTLRTWDTKYIGLLYFGSLCVYATLGLIMLNTMKGEALLKVSTNLYNYALAISCWHVVAVNALLLPKEVKPPLWRQAALCLAGSFFMLIALLTTASMLEWL